MSIAVDILRDEELPADTPGDHQLMSWLRAALIEEVREGELCLRVVNEDEGKRLNRTYRNRDFATNVLSFPADDMSEITPRPLGDLVICAPVVLREAADQSKQSDAHWAHLCVHGALHLLGYDHEAPAEAHRMEAREVEILARLGYQDPYRAGA